jgi:hypothetical protein
LQAPVEGENAPVLSHGDGTDKNIDGSALDTATAAEIEESRRFFVVGRGEGFIGKSFEGAL